MLPDESGQHPRIANDANSLGVRILAETDGEHSDIAVDPDGNVHPGREGMSVSPSIEQLPLHKIPRFASQFRNESRRPKGNNKVICWSAGQGRFVDAPFTERIFVMTSPRGSENHGVLSPVAAVSLEQYRADLNETLPMWQSVEWPWDGAKE